MQTCLHINVFEVAENMNFFPNAQGKRTRTLKRLSFIKIIDEVLLLSSARRQSVSTIKCGQVMLISVNICAWWKSYEIHKYEYSPESLQNLLMLHQMGQLFTSNVSLCPCTI